MAWILLLLAGLFEVVWSFSLKQSHGFSRLWPSLVTIATALVSFWLLAAAMRTLPLGTAYAIWTGIGALGAFTIGILVLGESASPARIASAGLILAGIIGLKVTAG